MEVKELKARGNASTKADEAKGKLDNFNNTKTPTKTFQQQEMQVSSLILLRVN